jgi:UDP-2-acetamido-3-amino-2,3-dideoxy-glucuronate N-acetyltransferase
VTKPYTAHPTAVLDGESPDNDFVDPNIGAGTRIWHFVHVCRGARIGEGVMLGQGVYVAPTAVIGNGCRLQNNVSVYDGVQLEEHVFCGPSMVFTNVSKPVPRAAVPRGEARFERTVVRRHASIGAGAVIVCGREIGEASFIGAGAVVIRDVPAFGLVVGNPARLAGWVCACGKRLDFGGRAHARCECGAAYRQIAPDLVEREL